MAALPYEERLSWSGLYSLVFIIMRGDLIEINKVLIGLERGDAGKTFPKVGMSRTRAQSLMIQKSPCLTNMRNFFTQTVVSLWHSLPQKVVEVKILSVVKQLDVVFGMKVIQGYGGKAGSGYRAE